MQLFILHETLFKTFFNSINFTWHNYNIEFQKKTSKPWTSFNRSMNTHEFVNGYWWLVHMNLLNGIFGWWEFWFKPLVDYMSQWVMHWFMVTRFFGPLKCKVKMWHLPRICQCGRMTIIHAQVLHILIICVWAILTIA